jgi:5'-deoxynucleotidase YfbR-like HD superfamily hydrolase
MKSQKSKVKSQKLVDFIFEASTLTRLKRTGWQILGAGNSETIASHTFMVSIISLVLGQIMKANIEKVLLMSLLHDFSETRTGDIYKLADYYVSANTPKADFDSFSNLQDSQIFFSLIEECHLKKSLEAQIVSDADVLALIIELKILIENGNTNAKEWLDANLNFLKLEESKKLGIEIQKGNSQRWWEKYRKLIHKSTAK